VNPQQPNIATAARLAAILGEMTAANAADGLLKILAAVHDYALSQGWPDETTQEFTLAFGAAISQAMRARHYGTGARH
jgi:hypothetical protein